MWGQFEGLSSRAPLVVSGMSQAGERNAMAEGTLEKVQAHRRGKAPLLGSARAGGVDTLGNSLHWSVHMSMGSQRLGWLWRRLQVSRSLLLI